MRPLRRVYKYDDVSGEWVDARILEARDGKKSKQDGIIFRPRVYRNLGPTPVYVESPSQLKAICKARNLVLAG